MTKKENQQLSLNFLVFIVCFFLIFLIFSCIIQSENAILGIDFWRKTNAIFDFSNDAIFIKETNKNMKFCVKFVFLLDFQQRII